MAKKTTTTEKTQPQSSASSRSGGTCCAPACLTHDQIAKRAREIWLAKGCPVGRDEQNWRDAEAQLKKELGVK